MIAFAYALPMISQPEADLRKVQQVQLAIYNADGSLVETGDAAKQANEIDWVYTATVANDSTVGDRIVIRASDQPCNIAEEEQAL